MKSKTVTGSMLIVLAMIVACATPTPEPTKASPTVTLLPATPTIISIPSTVTPVPVVTATLAPTFTPTLPPTPLPTLTSELKGRFVVLKPSAQDELNRIWDTLKTIAFYDQYGYTPTFPNDPMIKPLLEKAREKKLNNQDYADLSKLVLDKLYLSEDYDPSYQKVIASFPIVEQILPTFQKYNGLWGFKLFPVYTIRLTMYGIGGSYNPQKGEIILLTSKDATFARGTDPSDTIMHEAVHLGIEDVIIQKFSIDQRVKERIVDRFMFDHFLSLVPRYRMQSIGDTSIDKYMSGGAAWENLPEKIKEFKSGK